MKSTLLSFLLTIFGFSLIAQSQQHSYKLYLHHPERLIKGDMELNYVNRSAEATSEIYIHLPSRSLEWKGSLLHQQFIDFQDVKAWFGKEKELGYLKISSDSSTQGDYIPPYIFHDEEAEFVRVSFHQPLPPDSAISLHFNFSMKVPEATFTGMGYDGQMYKLINWFPRLAMQDSSGWQLNPVTYQNDIYQNFDDFNFQLNIPADFEALCNGVEDTLQLKANRKIYQLRISNSLAPQIFIAPNFYAYPLGENSTLYLPVREEFLVAGIEQFKKSVDDFFEKELGEGISREYNILMLTQKKEEYQSENLLSLEMPKDLFQLSADLAHARAQQLFRYSISHNGIEEVWLSRGLPYFYKFRYIREEYPEKKWLPFSNSFIGKFFDLDEFDFDYQNQFLYLYLARQGLDQPMSTPADSLNRLNYEAVAQGKSFLAFSHLAAYMGERDFKRGMRRYYLSHYHNRGNSEALQKDLMYYHFKDLEWFFKGLVHSKDYTDYVVKGFDHCPTVTTATVKNENPPLIPFSVTGFKDGKEVHTDWFEGHTGTKSLQLYHSQYDKIIINRHQNVPEYSLNNNSYRTKGLFRRAEPLRLQLWNGFEDPDKTQIFWMPSASFNAYDQLLAGISFYNKSLVNKPIEYVIGPEYSTGTGSITGYGSLLFNITPARGYFHRITAGIFTRYRHYDEGLAYFRASPSLNFYFKRSHPKSDYLQKIRLRTVTLERELPPSFEGQPNTLSNASYSIFNANYILEDINVLSPYTLDFDFQWGTNFSKLGFTADMRWMLPNRKWLIWRQFAGVFLRNDFREQGLDNNYYSFGLSGTRDYMFDYELIGRSDESGIWSRQFFVTDGGFKTQTGVFADRYMATSNLTIPIWSVIGVFGSVGISDENPLHWEYGGRLAIFTDFLEFYFPIRNDQTNFLEKTAYYQHIRFVLNADLSEIIARLRRGYY